MPALFYLGVRGLRWRRSGAGFYQIVFLALMVPRALRTHYAYDRATGGVTVRLLLEDGSLTDSLGPYPPPVARLVGQHLLEDWEGGLSPSCCVHGC